MKELIAIHHRPGSYSDRWIEFCKEKSIPFKIVDCHRSDIVKQLNGCQALMWHFSQTYIEDMLIADAVVRSAEAMGIRVFPNSSTSWYFDDKVAQKYLVEALSIPGVPSYVFVDREGALAWVEQATYPKVFKLRGGAGGSNVRLVNGPQEAKKLVRRAFGSGFPPVPRWHALKERWWQFKRDRDFRSLANISRGIARAIMVNPTLDRLPWQKGYVYFQDFVANNDSDVRVVVIGDRAFAIKRMVRNGDFRASGSGRVIYDIDAIPAQCVQNAFEVSEVTKAQSLALDFVFFNGRALIVEMSYAFTSAAYRDCPGYWMRDGSWVEGSFRAEDFMVEDMLSSLSEQ